MDEARHMDTIDVVSPDELKEGDDTPGIDRKVAFETENNVVIRAHVDGGTASGWHHHGNRDVYGYLLEGKAAFDYGPGGSDRQEVDTGEFFHIPSHTVHRDVNPTDEGHVLLLSFVGSGPLVENVDGPRSE